jgi:hypothetical protein
MITRAFLIQGLFLLAFAVLVMTHNYFILLALLLACAVTIITRVLLDLQSKSKGKAVPGGVKLITDKMISRVRLPRYQPATLGLIAFVDLLLVATPIAAFVPQFSIVWLCSCVLLGTALVYGWQLVKVHSGMQDLVIDEGVRTILLPRTYKRHEQPTLAFSVIKSVLLDKVTHRGKGGRVYYSFLVVLEMTDGTRQRLGQFNEFKAEELASWLNGKLGLAGSRESLAPAS